MQVEIQSELDANKVFVQGVDREGRATMVLLVARHSMRSCFCFSFLLTSTWWNGSGWRCKIKMRCMPRLLDSCCTLQSRIRKLEETKKTICYTLDALIRLHDLNRNPQGKSVGIFDLRG